MNIQEIAQKCKSFITLFDRSDIATVLTIILVATSSFGLGRLSKIGVANQGIIIENTTNTASVMHSATSVASDAKNNITANTDPQKTFVASKNGTKYYYSWCSGANRIKEENKVWFGTKEAALRAGFQPAANCSGL